MRRPSRSFALIALTLALAGCTSEEEEEKYAAQMEAVRGNYVSIVHASYEDSLEAAEDLDDAIADFLEEPSAGSFATAREAWLAAREPYLQTEVYRFYDGPIDNPEDGPEGLINAWPMDEAYVDYVLDGDEVLNGGIVNDDVAIDGETLEGLNEAGGEENIATGYHAVEFLLWGQDHSETGPGDRPHTDYVTGDDGTAENQDRRGEYLATASSLIVGHLEDLVEAWAEDEENYHHEFEEVESKEAFRRILTGMVVLSGFETGGERLQAALDSHSQEDEHSCFSDNTHRDMVQDCQGIKNVWDGSYTRLDGSVVSGPGVRTVVEALDANLAKNLDDQIQQSLDLANELVPPFDQEIAAGNDEGNARVEALITSLHRQNDLLEEVFRRLELTVPNPE
ncbi:MAG TPA: imelysin family protein [Polyangiaceae bacterium]